MQKSTKLKKIPAFKSDLEAEEFVTRADLSQYDLSGGEFVRFEMKPKDKSVNLRFAGTASRRGTQAGQARRNALSALHPHGAGASGERVDSPPPSRVRAAISWRMERPFPFDLMPPPAPLTPPTLIFLQNN